MSINDFMNKIKGKIDIDRTTLLCLLVIVLVGLSSFGLGRLSISGIENENTLKLENDNVSIVKEETGDNAKVESDKASPLKEKMYVASKNGKLYYGATCSGAKRISLKNEVWFASREDAEKSGYELSSSCK
jgi:hypothetical protein